MSSPGYKTFLIISFSILFSINIFGDNNLNVSFLVSNRTHRKAIREVVELFENENPDIRVNLIEKDNESYHIWFDNWQESDADVLWWFAGYQLKNMASRDLIEPVTDIWESENLNDSFPTLKRAVTYGIDQYGIPLSYYHWGFYYKKSLFRKYNLKEPENWEQFIALCNDLKNSGITPLGVATKNNWPAAAWFSYLNIRLNGVDFHHNLLEGRESYLDRRVVKIFEIWKDLIELDFFNDNNGFKEWNDILPYIYRDKVGLYLIGNFVMGNITIDKEDIGCFRFPIIDENIPIYEEAPTDVLFLNKTSPNKESAKLFLKFMSRADIQFMFNEEIKAISPNRNSSKSNDSMILKGLEILNSSKETTQFYDRDTSKGMAETGFTIFGEFVRTPNIDLTVHRLEIARLEYFK